MIWEAIDWLSTIFDICIYVFFFYRCLRIRSGTFNHKHFLLTLAYIGIKLLYDQFGFGYNQYVSIVLSVLYCAYVFQGPFRAHIVWAATTVALNGVVNYLVMNASVLVPGITYATTDLPGLPRALCIFATKLLLFAAFFIMTIRVEKGANMNWGSFLLLICLPVGSMALLQVLFSYSQIIPEPSAHALLPIIASLCIMLMMVTSIFMYNHLILREKEYARMEVALRNEQLIQTHTQQLNRTYARLSSLQHSLKTHFAVISDLYHQKEYAKIGEYVEELFPSGFSASSFVGNPIIDALLNNRHAIANESGINLRTQIALPEQMPISDVNTSILFGDLLDNAFEAAQKQSDPAKRCIRLITKVVDDYWVVMCENATGPEEFETFDNLPSSKQGDDLHGLGTMEIKTIAEDTGGYVSFKQQNGLFTATVLLMLPENDDKCRERTPRNGLDDTQDHRIFS